MRGIYTRQRDGGTAVCISYTPPGAPRVREVIEFVDEHVALIDEATRGWESARPAEPESRGGR